jgi:anti-sigma B factor antagonist
MKISISREPSVAVAAVSGDITHATAPEFQQRLLEELAGGKNLVLDFSELNLLTSSGLRGLLLLHRAAADGDCRLVLAAVPEAVRDVMEVTGFWDQFGHYPSLAEARTALA